MRSTIEAYGQRSPLEMLVRALKRMLSIRKGWIVSSFISFYDRIEISRICR